MRPSLRRFLRPQATPPENEVNWTAWSHGQILSKTDLCEKLEGCFPAHEPWRVWVFAGWYGLLPFLLQTRGRFALAEARVFDQDAAALLLARRINNVLETEGRFGVVHADVNRVHIPDAKSGGPDLLVNTSCEHFERLDWWSAVPAGTWVALQGTDMPHEEHVRPYTTIESFEADFPGLGELRCRDTKVIVSGDKTFRRFTLIGRKVAP